MRNLALSLLLGLSLVACSGGAAGDGDQTAPPTGGGGGTGGGSGGGGSGGGGTPAPVVVFDDAAIPLGKPGGFPSDLVVDGLGRLFTVDDAFVPANVVAYTVLNPSAPPLLKVPVTASDLIDHDGTSPATAPTANGNGLFGAFTGDLEVVFDRWLLVTVGAGNSISDDGTGPLRLANLVVIDTLTGKVVQTVNLAWVLQAPGSFSNAGTYPAIPQSLPAMVAFVPAGDGSQTGHVFVAMSNGAGSSAGLYNYFHGTVQSWRVDFGAAIPLSPETAGKAALDVTRTYVSAFYNPVGFTHYANARAEPFLIVTNAGASGFDANYVARPTTDAVLEFLDVRGADWRDQWTVNLGEILPAVGGRALGVDGQGRTFAALSSQTFAAAYFVDLSGLEADPVDPGRLRLLRTVELAPGGALTLGSGYQPGVALSPGGRTALVSSFTAATLHVLALPDDLEFGDIVVGPPPLDALGPAQATLGAVVAPRGAAADAFFVVNGTFDAQFLPSRSSHVGTLTLTGDLP